MNKQRSRNNPDLEQAVSVTKQAVIELQGGPFSTVDLYEFKKSDNNITNSCACNATH